MKRNERFSFLQKIEKNILIGDGAFGTSVFKKGLLRPGAPPEILNLENSQAVTEIHREYLQAGADIIETNSFGANRLKLAHHGLSGKVRELNSAAVHAAKKALSGYSGFVAGSIGPAGVMPGKVAQMLSQLSDVFSEQASALAEAGADLIIIETFSDLLEFKTAVTACRSITDLPIIALMTFEKEGFTITGCTPQAMAVVAKASGADLTGMNCSVGPEEMHALVSSLISVSQLPVAVFPNAGLPQLINGQTVFPGKPEEFSRLSESFYQLGVAVTGGCCGTGPEHISAVSSRLKGCTRNSVSVPVSEFVCSNSQTFAFGLNRIPLIIGERINPTGRKKLSRDISEGTFSLLREEAQKQSEEGADVLDLNVSVPGLKEKEAMYKALAVAENCTDRALCIDSGSPATLLEVIPAVCGRPILNSISGKEAALEKLMPVIKKTGCVAISLLLDDDGIPDTVSGRIRVAEKILHWAEKQGVGTENLLFDALTLTVGAERNSVKTGLETIRELNRRGLFTSMGVSNVSHGLPGRAHLNASFVSMVIEAGVNAMIINPGDQQIMSAFRSACALTAKDQEFRKYYEFAAGTVAQKDISVKSSDKKQMLFAAVLNGSSAESASLTRELLLETDGLNILNTILMPAITQAGELFEKKKYFLPQLISAAEAMNASSELINKAMKSEEKKESDGSVMIATVEGDIHDIGKNIVLSLLKNYGFKVSDLGKDVKAETIVEAVRSDETVRVLGLSALMTTTMVHMEDIINRLQQENLRNRVKVVLGGAVLNQEYAQRIGADFYASDALAGLKIISGILK